MLAAHGDFFGNSKIIFRRVLPVDKVHRFVILADGRLDLGAITQQLIHVFVVGVEGFVRIIGCRPQRIERFGDQRGGITTPAEVGTQQGFFDVAVIRPVFPFAEIPIVQFLAE